MAESSIQRLRERLTKLLRPLRHHLNLVSCNPVEHTLLEPPSRFRVQRFAANLRARGLNVSVRHTQGADIEAACGQLRQRADAGS